MRVLTYRFDNFSVGPVTNSVVMFSNCLLLLSVAVPPLPNLNRISKISESCQLIGRSEVVMHGWTGKKGNLLKTTAYPSSLLPWVIHVMIISHQSANWLSLCSKLCFLCSPHKVEGLQWSRKPEQAKFRTIAASALGSPLNVKLHVNVAWSVSV